MDPEAYLLGGLTCVDVMTSSNQDTEVASIVSLSKVLDWVPGSELVAGI